VRAFAKTKDQDSYRLTYIGQILKVPYRSIELVIVQGKQPQARPKGWDAPVQMILAQVKFGQAL